MQPTADPKCPDCDFLIRNFIKPALNLWTAASVKYTNEKTTHLLYLQNTLTRRNKDSIWTFTIKGFQGCLKLMNNKIKNSQQIIYRFNTLLLKWDTTKCIIWEFLFISMTINRKCNFKKSLNYKTPKFKKMGEKCMLSKEKNTQYRQFSEYLIYYESHEFEITYFCISRN